MILEYRLEMTEGGLKAPAWIEDGGYFPKNKTLIGWSPKEAHRDYLIPDIANELTPTELIQRVQSLGMIDIEGNNLTNAEIEALVNDWIEVREDHNMDLLRAANMLFENCYQDSEGTIYVNGEALTPEQLDQVTAKAEEIKIQEETENAYKRLQEVCDTKSQEAKNFINGARVTDELLEEYEIKVELAKDYKQNGTSTEKLQLEADLVGKTVDELATLILQLNDQYCEAYNTYKMMIGAFRVKVKRLIASGQLDEANRIIEIAKGFDVNTTEAAVRAVFE